MLGDGQAESGAASFPGARGIHAVEAFKNARLVCLGNADTRVCYGKDHFSVARLGAENDLALRQRVLRRIVQKILQDLGEPAAVTCDIRQSVRKLNGNSDVL